jgi:hypothetical protein
MDDVANDAHRIWSFVYTAWGTWHGFEITIRIRIVLFVSILSHHLLTP